MVRRFNYIFNKSSFGEIICEKVGVETEKDNNHFLSLYSESFGIVYCFYGKLSIRAGDKQLTLEERGVLLIYPDTPLSFTSCGEFCYGYIRFSGYAISKLITGINRVKPIELEPCRLDCIREFFTTQKGGGAGYELEAMSAVFTVLSRATETPSESEQKRPSVIDLFIEMTENNFNRPDFKIAEACLELGVSVSYFTMLFSKTMGVSPYQYVINYRMNKAKGMLKKSHLSIKEIAGYVGYDDALHFSGEFKKYTGMSPSEYRRTIGDI